ncbi:MAG: LON peptidase substrate-binding domain-containing protein, partial [Acidobacteria bacterium]|nr:LON peptidase substrate-binding domain-containing protein [Acidobacteriota bacterium]
MAMFGKPKEKSEYTLLPMVPIRDVVLFPHMMIPFVIGRPASVKALEVAFNGDKRIFLATQHDAAVDDPQPSEIYSTGTVANIVQSLRLPDGNIKVLVEGLERAKALQILEEDEYMKAVLRPTSPARPAQGDTEALVNKVTSLFEQYVKLSQNLNYDTMVAAVRVEDIDRLADTVAANLAVTIEEKQELLEIFNPVDRLHRLKDILDVEIEKLNVDRSINSGVKRQIEKAQKEYYLRG